MTSVSRPRAKASKHGADSNSPVKGDLKVCCCVEHCWYVGGFWVQQQEEKVGFGPV